MDASFVVATPTSGVLVSGAFPSFAPVPLDDAKGLRERTVELAAFSQLPDFSFSLWDWASGNETCPPDGTSGSPALCHDFKGHLSWLNSTHFVPQAQQVFIKLHAAAVSRANQCRTLSNQLDLFLPQPDRDAIIQACDRESLLIEAIAHHYLQDAWSMGHMWQRWGSPSVGPFNDARNGATLEEHAKTLGIAAGLIHGAKAVSTIDDALCAPGVGIDFVFSEGRAGGAGDLFLTPILENELFAEQRQRMLSCLAAAQREVYAASAQSFGDLNPLAAVLDPVDPTGEVCFGQRATNRAIEFAAGIDLSDGWNLSEEGEAMITQILVGMGLPEAAERRFLPLTSEQFGRLCGEFLGDELCAIAPVLQLQWADDMLRVSRAIDGAHSSPFATDLADGGLGVLLGMEPNGFYDVAAAEYLDPPEPWSPTRLAASIPPSIASAQNILARTFREGHVAEWCAAMTGDGNDEFSLTVLRDRCRDDALSEEEHDAACEICTRWTTPHAASAGQLSTCGALRVAGALHAEPVTINVVCPAGAEGPLAELWCRGEILRVTHDVDSDCNGTPLDHSLLITTTAVGSDGAELPIEGEVVEISVNDSALAVVGLSDSNGELRYPLPLEEGSYAVVVRALGKTRSLGFDLVFPDVTCVPACDAVCSRGGDPCFGGGCSETWLCGCVSDGCPTCCGIGDRGIECHCGEFCL